MTSNRDYEEVIINADVFVSHMNRLWLDCETLAVFFLYPEKENKNHPTGILLKASVQSPI